MNARAILVSALSAFCAAFLSAGELTAHELGATQVTATVVDGRYRIDITVDPDTLVTRLQAFAGLPLAPTASIESLRDAFLDRVTVAFDGRRVPPRFEYVPGSIAIVRLTGLAPPGAGELTFTYGLALGAFALVAHVDGAPPQEYWLDGPRAAQTIALAATGAGESNHGIIVIAFALATTFSASLRSRRRTYPLPAGSCRYSASLARPDTPRA